MTAMRGHPARAPRGVATGSERTRPAVRPRSLVATLCCTGVVAIVVACGPSSDAVSPLAAGATGTASTEAPDAPSVAPSIAVGSPGGPSPTANGSDLRTPPAEAATDVLRAEVEELLDAHDRALADLYASPGAATDLDHPLTVAFHRVVPVDSALDRELRTRIATDARDNRMRIVADPTGTSFRDVPLAITSDSDGSVAWDNCGYVPGVGVHIDTGEVIDDRRGSTRGHGRAERDGDGALRLVELVDDSLTVLGPGEGDPCPALAEEARSQEARSAEARSAGRAHDGRDTP